jgi:type I site-specific restriction endonuclease
VIHKLRSNQPLTTADLDALEKIPVEAGAGTPDDLSKVRSGSGLGLFVREMIGLASLPERLTASRDLLYSERRDFPPTMAYVAPTRGGTKPN